MNGIDDAVGTLEVGKEADVIVVDGDPVADLSTLAHVQMTFVRGCLMYSR
jgi:imidazolonepropionase-like amidohydrolase